MTSEQDICEAFGFDKIETDDDIAHQTIVLYAQRGGYELSRSIARIVLTESVGGGDLVLRRAWRSMSEQFDRENVPRPVRPVERCGPAVIVGSHVYNFDHWEFRPETESTYGVLIAKRGGFTVEYPLVKGGRPSEQHMIEIDRLMTAMERVGHGDRGMRADRIVFDDPKPLLDARAQLLKAMGDELPSDYADRLRKEFGLPDPVWKAEDILAVRPRHAATTSLDPAIEEWTKPLRSDCAVGPDHNPGARKPGHKPTPDVPKWAKSKRDRGTKPGGSR